MTAENAARRTNPLDNLLKAATNNNLAVRDIRQPHSVLNLRLIQDMMRFHPCFLD